MRSVIISCGGTGGHISPGVALLEEILSRKDELKVSFIALHSPRRNQDNPDLSDLSVPIFWHNLPRLHKFNFMIYPFLLLWELLKTFFIFYNQKVTDIIGMGGYTSLPALIYARVFQVSYYLCEQNCIPGKITRVFSKRCKKLAFSFPPSYPIDSSIDYKVLGNPLRRSVLPRIPGLKTKLLSKKNPLNVLVLGGSQGARQINTMVLSAMENAEIREYFKFRMITGTNLYEEVRSRSLSIEAISYSKDMRTHYEWADLVICRSGAGVLAECSAYALPLILIPYPYSADNHQMANAEYYQTNHACILLNTISYEADALLEALMTIVKNPGIVLEMSKASLALSCINASRNTVDYFFS